MAALGLTSYGQFALGSTIYTTLVEKFAWLPGTPIYIVHTVSLSTKHPTSWQGRGPATIEGVMQTTATNERAWLSALQTATERKASWVDHDGTEVYAYVNAGEVTSRMMVGGLFGPASGSKMVRTGFRFVCGDQRLYNGTTDAVLIGG